MPPAELSPGHPIAPVSAARLTPLRIRHVDSLRAVAACLVVWSHFAQLIGPVSGRDPAVLGFLLAVPRAWNLGRLGVIIFFAVSGFVICRSFGGPREGGARRFLIKRFCRLYPAYWVSMLAGSLVWWASGNGFDWPLILGNATMLPGTLGQPILVGVYWTLEIELLFYGLCLGLYLARALDWRAVLAACVLMLAALPRLMKIVSHATGADLRLVGNRYNLVMCLAVMFWGAVFRLVYDETGGFRGGAFKKVGTWQLVLLTLALIDVTDPNIKWVLLGRYTGPMPSYFLESSALLIFAVWVACLRIDNAIMTRLGVISYSLYLFHPLPMYFVPRLIGASRMIRGWGLPFWFYGAVGFAVSVALAEGVYQCVERPAITLGKRWAGAPRGTASREL